MNADMVRMGWQSASPHEPVKMLLHRIPRCCISALLGCCCLQLVGTFGAEIICLSTPNLTPTQLQICRNVSEAMVVMNEVMETFRDECSWQFKTSRWNCTGVTSPVYVSAQLGGLESAFVYGLTSAITVQKITDACFEYRLGDYCSPDHSRIGDTSPEGWMWGRNYDILKGTEFAQRFLDSRDLIDLSDPTTSITAAIHLHNNAAGRRAVYNNRKLRCVCHGVSGSCSVKTCTTILPSIFDIGDIMKVKYERATRVNARLENGEITIRSVERDGEEGGEPTATDLIFVAPPTNHCSVNPNYTESRFCLPRANLTSVLQHFYPPCEEFCCNGEYRSTRKTVAKSCNCYFEFCCDLKCTSCDTTYTEYVCSGSTENSTNIPTTT